MRSSGFVKETGHEKKWKIRHDEPQTGMASQSSTAHLLTHSLTTNKLTRGWSDSSTLLFLQESKRCVSRCMCMCKRARERDSETATGRDVYATRVAYIICKIMAGIIESVGHYSAAKGTDSYHGIAATVDCVVSLRFRDIKFQV